MLLHALISYVQVIIIPVPFFVVVGLCMHDILLFHVVLITFEYFECINCPLCFSCSLSNSICILSFLFKFFFYLPPPSFILVVVVVVGVYIGITLSIVLLQGDVSCGKIGSLSSMARSQQGLI